MSNLVVVKLITADSTTYYFGAMSYDLDKLYGKTMDVVNQFYFYRDFKEAKLFPYTEEQALRYLKQFQKWNMPIYPITIEDSGKGLSVIIGRTYKVMHEGVCKAFRCREDAYAYMTSLDSSKDIQFSVMDFQ